MKIKFVLFFLLVLLLMGCATQMIYYNSEPMVKGQVVKCINPNVISNVYFIIYDEIREGKEVLLWPTGLELEREYKFRNLKKITMKINVANGFREKITLIHKKIIVKGGDVKEESVTLYSGKLPYREYEVNLPTTKGSHIETWFEFHNKNGMSCMTGRAIYQVVK